MACGTPVDYRSGSVPEVVEDGVTGFIVDNEEQAVRAVGDLGRLDSERYAPASRNAFPRTEWRKRTRARTAN
jgi:glycosyltransferase involved in cell wall biosynthesis